MFSDIELSRRLERAEGHANARFVEARARRFPEIGATWTEVAGAWAMFDGVASPITQTFGLGLFETIGDADLDRLEDFFRARGAPVFHEVSPLASGELWPMLHARGYRAFEFTSVLYRPISATHEPLNARGAGIHVRPVAPDERALSARISARGWSHLPELTDFLHEVSEISADREGSLSFFAELGEEPVALGTLCIHDGVALLAGACTVPEARGRGAQLALLDERLRVAAERGCNVAMMGALPGSASQRNAERQGFRIAYTRIKWQLG
jgi:GNAT superfamily N-acetyltransferase